MKTKHFPNYVSHTNRPHKRKSSKKKEKSIRIWVGFALRENSLMYFPFVLVAIAGLLPWRQALGSHPSPKRHFVARLFPLIHFTMYVLLILTCWEDRFCTETSCRENMITEHCKPLALRKRSSLSFEKNNHHQLFCFFAADFTFRSRKEISGKSFDSTPF